MAGAVHAVVARPLADEQGRVPLPRRRGVRCAVARARARRRVEDRAEHVAPGAVVPGPRRVAGALAAAGARGVGVGAERGVVVAGDADSGRVVVAHFVGRLSDDKVKWEEMRVEGEENENCHDH